MTIKEKKIGSILIVEDNEINRIVVETLLSKSFYTDSVTNGVDALAAVEQKNYDIILMDINLGDEELDGTRVMKIIRADKKHEQTKIFAVTAYYDDREMFLKEGFDNFFMKPVIKEEMIEAINQILLERSSNGFTEKTEA